MEEKIGSDAEPKMAVIERSVQAQRMAASYAQDAPLPCSGIRCQKATGQFKKGKTSGLFLVKPLGDKMPYGTRQEAAQKPESEGFQHQLFLCLRRVHTNAKDPIGKTYGVAKNSASCTSAESGGLYTECLKCAKRVKVFGRARLKPS
jgi:hypothetical protein